LWIYSDGVPEAMNSQLESFGEERLNQSVERHRDKQLQATVNSVLHEVEDWCLPSGPKDDVSILALEIDP
jgi:serine phosphatase RsbU (regulator of sigma subunit)